MNPSHTPEEQRRRDLESLDGVQRQTAGAAEENDRNVGAVSFVPTRPLDISKQPREIKARTAGLRQGLDGILGQYEGARDLQRYLNDDEPDVRDMSEK